MYLTPFQKRSPNSSWTPQASSSFHLLSLPTSIASSLSDPTLSEGKEVLVKGGFVEPAQIEIGHDLVVAGSTGPNVGASSLEDPEH